MTAASAWRTVWAALLSASALATAATSDCGRCHPGPVANRLGMGRSFRLADPPAARPSAVLRHAPSNSRLEAKGRTHAVNGKREQIRYVVGSGHAGESYLIERPGGALYQSPLSWFAGGKGWGVSPGYEKDRVLDFSRPVPEECLFCHAGGAAPVAGSLNRYETPPAPDGGIPCERCHGPGEAHAANPARANIVNPARLAGPARDSVCEQCHLSGEARVLNPGKRWQDFRPGAELPEETFTTYVRDGPVAGLAVVSHAEQFAASACFRKSQGRLGCATCHQVHAPSPPNHRDACIGCHPVLQKPHPVSFDCVGCHMPSRRAFDGGHTPFTDHRIARRPSPSPSREQVAPPAALRPWRQTPFDERNFGLALAQAADRWRSRPLLEAAYAWLAPRRQQFARDPEVLGALGYALLRSGQSAEAIPLLAAAVHYAPRMVRFRLNLALALAEAGRSDAARRALRELLELDPSVEPAREALAKLDRQP